MTLEVRQTTQADREQVLEVVRAAFSQAPAGGQDEVDIVQATWRAGAAPGLDLVAVEDGRILGHVLTGVGRMNGEAAVGIAPLCVRPDLQRSGVGSQLMANLIKRLRADGWPFVVLLGDPRYYSRFGFEAAGPFGLVYAGARMAEAFQILWLNQAPHSLDATYVYCFESAAM